MLLRFGALFSKLTVALALIATLGVSVLPNGQIPEDRRTVRTRAVQLSSVMAEVPRCETSEISGRCKNCIRRSAAGVLTSGRVDILGS